MRRFGVRQFSPQLPQKLNKAGLPQPVTPLQSVVGEAGLEPTTPGLEGRCSIQLSYSPASFHFSVEVASVVQAGRRMASTKTPSAAASVETASIRVDPMAVRYAVIPRSWRAGAMKARRTTRSARQQRKTTGVMPALNVLAAAIASAGVGHC